MWRPANIHAIPSPEDLLHAKKVIHETERKLATAAQVDTAVRKDLQDLKYFITPIRRIPFEIMSIIFEMSSGDGKAIARIAQVSRIWRSIALCHPRAWSTLTISSKVSYTHIPILLNRSAEHALHLKCPTNMPSFFLSQAIHRIHCLSIDSILLDMPDLVFQKTECLHIQFKIVLQRLISSKFPVLRHLRCDFTIIPSPSLFALPDAPTFPGLESLSMSIASDSGWIDVLRYCSTTLRYLKLHEPHPYMEYPLGPFHLPNLVSLTIRTPFDRLFLQIDMRTPSLDVYDESVDMDYGECHLHTDTLTVTFLRTNRKAPRLEWYPQLQVLQTSGSVCVVLMTLLHSRQLCLKLERIEEYDGSMIGNVQDLLLQVNQARTCKITLTNGWKTNIPTNFRGTCEEDMHGIE